MRNIIKNINRTLMKGVRRVYCYDDLGAWNCGASCWNTEDVTDVTQIEKILNHLKDSWDFKVYCDYSSIYFTCRNRRYGQIKCKSWHNYMFFEFGLPKSSTRYDINYLLNRDNEEICVEFREWLKNMFGDIQAEYFNDRNL